MGLDKYIGVFNELELFLNEGNINSMLFEFYDGMASTVTYSYIDYD